MVAGRQRPHGREASSRCCLLTPGAGPRPSGFLLRWFTVGLDTKHRHSEGHRCSAPNTTFGELFHFSTAQFSYLENGGGTVGPWGVVGISRVQGPASRRYSDIGRHQRGFPAHLPDPTTCRCPGWSGAPGDVTGASLTGLGTLVFKQRLSMHQASGRLKPAVCLHVESGDLGSPPPSIVYPPVQGRGLRGGTQRLLLGALHGEKAER